MCGFSGGQFTCNFCVFRLRQNVSLAMFHSQQLIHSCYILLKYLYKYIMMTLIRFRYRTMKQARICSESKGCLKYLLLSLKMSRTGGGQTQGMSYILRSVCSGGALHPFILELTSGGQRDIHQCAFRTKDYLDSQVTSNGPDA